MENFGKKISSIKSCFDLAKLTAKGTVILTSESNLSDGETRNSKEIIDIGSYI